MITLPACTCIMSVALRDQKVSDAPCSETGATAGCESPCEYWELNH